MKAQHKLLLLILDGWGIGKDDSVSAIHKAKTPFMDNLWQSYPHSHLEASGLAVGLPEGQMGNSEVGHMNIGAGRVVYQDLVRINKAIEEGALANHPLLLEAFSYARGQGKKVHFIGLASEGGVHAHLHHLKALCTVAAQQHVEQLFIHAFTDGRDADPYEGLGCLTSLEEHLKQTTGRIASITGRYYAMDRDLRWERTKIAYDGLVKGLGQRTSSWQKAVEASYLNGITDEFVQPIIVVDNEMHPIGCIDPEDVVLCFNFRTDRARQITEALTQRAILEWDMTPLPLYYITCTPYDPSFKGVHILFDKRPLDQTLGEVLSLYGKQQVRIAETEKYPHVTYFFSGGRETPFVGETRILCPSPKVKTYDQAPAMSIFAVTTKTVTALEAKDADFICVNFANADMVGHTGVWEAAVQACEAVDTCLAKVITTARQQGYLVLVVADHGNADVMINEYGKPYTAHTLNPVPCILIGSPLQSHLKDGILADVAPTILHCMGIPPPAAMTGHSLVYRT